MMRQLDADRALGTGFPTDEGARLARYVLDECPGGLDNVEVDLTRVPAGLIISAFFNAFLQHVFIANPNALAAAREITWKARFPFQEKLIAAWVVGFKPVAPQGDAG